MSTTVRLCTAALERTQLPYGCDVLVWFTDCFKVRTLSPSMRRWAARLAARQAHRIDSARDHRIDPGPPSGCGSCGCPERAHTDDAGHPYTLPQDQQILIRMRQRADCRPASAPLCDCYTQPTVLASEPAPVLILADGSEQLQIPL